MFKPSRQFNITERKVSTRVVSYTELVAHAYHECSHNKSAKDRQELFADWSILRKKFLAYILASYTEVKWCSFTYTIAV